MRLASLPPFLLLGIVPLLSQEASLGVKAETEKEAPAACLQV